MDLAVVLISIGAMVGSWAYYTSGANIRTGRTKELQLLGDDGLLERTQWIADIMKQDDASVASAIPSLSGPYLTQLLALARDATMKTGRTKKRLWKGKSAVLNALGPPSDQKCRDSFADVVNAIDIKMNTLDYGRAKDLLETMRLACRKMEPEEARVLQKLISATSKHVMNLIAKQQK